MERQSRSISAQSDWICVTSLLTANAKSLTDDEEEEKEEEDEEEEEEEEEETRCSSLAKPSLARKRRRLAL